MKKHYRFLIMATALLFTACGPGADTASLNLNDDSSAIINGTKVSTRAKDGSRGVVLFLPVNGLGMAMGICTATLLTDHSVLTAAHCYDKHSKTLAGFKIIFANNKGISTRSFLKREGTHEDVVIHPGFRDTKVGLLNDLAIAFFDGGVPAGFEPIEFERDQSKNYNNSFVTAFGYGKNKDSGEVFAVGFGSAGDLYKAIIKVNGAYGLMQDRYAILSKGNTQFICGGDSGGGQFINVNGKPRLIGVTSSVRGQEDIFGHVSCTEGRSTAMKVSYFASWIDEVHEAARR
ncbi:trypsin-like serine protease [Bdellovibrio sp. SKB1291214]|uniref:S1 family peptidase n=1 Tax=Bdellovibrio sp. SKB1291214 TaxID=1732569 RepID=UPI0015962CDC|nr:trypsin-like serine protease [Bdellovibrio sp. SKB1291214]UYL08462.1 trypsin-like serine protease [Bdellovibrio sp. SKB1291214]